MPPRVGLECIRCKAMLGVEDGQIPMFVVPVLCCSCQRELLAMQPDPEEPPP